jgi:hypothetical protein
MFVVVQEYNGLNDRILTALPRCGKPWKNHVIFPYEKTSVLSRYRNNHYPWDDYVFLFDFEEAFEFVARGRRDSDDIVSSG